MRRAPNIEWKNAKGLDTWPFKALFCLNLAKTARLIHHRSVCLHLKSFKQFIFCSDSICLFHRYYQRFLLHQKICCTHKKTFFGRKKLFLCSPFPSFRVFPCFWSHFTSGKSDFLPFHYYLQFSPFEIFHSEPCFSSLKAHSLFLSLCQKQALHFCYCFLTIQNCIAYYLF